MGEQKNVEVNIRAKGTNEAVQKAIQLVELLKEAKTLADELASIDYELLSKVDIQV